MEMRGVYSDGINNLDGTANPGDVVTYRLERVGWDLLTHVMPSDKTATIQEDGTLPETQLWASGGGGRNILCILPNGYSFRFRLEPGDDAISLEELHTLYAPPETPGLPALAEILGAETPGSPGAALISFIALGLLAIWRTVLDKLRERVTTADYETLAAAIAGAVAQGRELIVNSVVPVSADLDIPHDCPLRFEGAGRIEPGTGVTVRIYGPITAGAWRIFGGGGTIAGSPMIEAALPEWFGAEGDGETDDSPAIEQAARLHPVVRGQPTAIYLIDTQRQLWSLLDLHRAGRYRAGGWIGQSNFTDGYYCSVKVLRGTMFEDAHFRLTTQNNAVRKAHGFGFGDVTSATRLTGSGFRGCTFELADDLPDAPERPHVALVQSVDNWVVEDCIFTGTIREKALLDEFGDPKIDGDTGLPRYRQITRLAGFALYDSHDSNISRNHWYACQMAAVYEFCDRIQFNENQMRMCSTGVDCDKRDSAFTAIGNTIENDRDDTITETMFIERMQKGDRDAWFEFNGCNGITLKGNIAKYIQRFGIINNKKEVMKTWPLALAQSQSASDYDYTISSNAHLDGNRTTRSYLSALAIGSTWEDDVTIDPDTGEEIIEPSAHNGTYAGDNYFINDEFLECAISLDSTATGAVVNLYEGTGFRFGSGFLIDGSASESSGAFGVYAASSYTDPVSGSPIGATTYSTLKIEQFAGVIRNTTRDGLYCDTPERIRFAGLVIAACGTAIGGGGRQAFILYPERRTAKISGQLTIDPAGVSITTGLKLRSKLFKSGSWRLDTTQFQLLGHTTDLSFDDTASGSESVSSRCVIYRGYAAPLTIWPAHLGSTAASPYWLDQNGGVLIHWAAAHTNPDRAHVQIRVPENLIPDCMTVRCRVRSSATETTEIRTNRKNHKAGQGLGWDAEDILADSASVGTNWVDMTVATLTNLRAGDVVTLALRPRGASDTDVVSNKDVVSVWVGN